MKMDKGKCTCISKMEGINYENRIETYVQYDTAGGTAAAGDPTGWCDAEGFGLYRRSHFRYHRHRHGK